MTNVEKNRLNFSKYSKSGINHLSFCIPHSALGIGNSALSVAHFNIVGFRAAVAALEDTRLRGRPYAIAGGSGGRAVVWDISPEALKANIRPGMALAAAERIVRDLEVIPPNPAAYQRANGAIEAVISRYAPAWQNDGGGNLFLDITGTRRIFGPPADCLCRVLNEIGEKIGLGAAAAAASNKLVSKVASRTIRPQGLVEVPAGDEAAFLAHQDISLLPGMGPLLMRTLAVTGFREIGELAALGDEEALALFGKKGLLLRDAALGIDNSPVADGGAHRVIGRQADFPEDVIDAATIRGALASLVEHGGLELRKEKLGSRTLRLAVVYNDGVEAKGLEKTKRLLVTDGELLAAAEGLYQKTVTRRIRIRSVGISLEDLAPLGYEADLFEPPEESKKHLLQQALDRIQERYGVGSVMRGIVLAAAVPAASPVISGLEPCRHR